MNGLIYVAECKVNGKRYVGQTVRKFEVRQQQHKSESQIKDFHFYRAIRKYGWDNFTWGIIADGIESIDSLNELEKYWIAELDTFNNGYNSTTGGSNFEMSEEVKHKLSEVSTGRKLSEQTKIKIGKANIGEKSPCSKAVICLDLSTEKVEIFAGLREAKRYTGVSNSNISACCKGKLKQSGGYLWKYA